ncbi:MAG: hypothetical protein ACRC1G_12995 [Bradyrhizobium sp.]|nr:hypothetical protein [Bradyrhizobium sp.]
MLILVNFYFQRLVVNRKGYFGEVDLRRCFRFFAFAFAALIVGTSGQTGASRAQGARPIPRELPEARADSATAEVGNAVRIEVLANDVGVPPQGQPAPEMKVDNVPACATVQVDGRALVFRGSASCVGADVVFAYSVKLNDEWQSAAVSVTVRPAGADTPRSPDTPPRPQDPARRPPGSVPLCSLPDADWQMARIEGGTFDKSSIPGAIIDFAELIEDRTFSVTPFCITIDAIPSEPVERYFNNLNEDERRTQFPELATRDAMPPGQADPSRAAANASQTMALAFSKRSGERSGRALALPTLQEFVAAAWELESKYPGTPQAEAFLILVRSGNLQWTSSPCGPGKYWAIGPSTQSSSQGRLVKLCYSSSRIDRTGFRVVMKQ